MTTLYEIAYEIYNYITKRLNTKGHIYAFSNNRTLLSLSIEELKKLPDLNLRYLQVDSKHKCIPNDWNTGYDTFAIYTFL